MPILNPRGKPRGKRLNALQIYLIGMSLFPNALGLPKHPELLKGGLD